MRISDWSSDVCSSDLDHRHGRAGHAAAARTHPHARRRAHAAGAAHAAAARIHRPRAAAQTLTRRFRPAPPRSEEHTSELQSLMRLSYAVLCSKKKNTKTRKAHEDREHVLQDTCK